MGGADGVAYHRETVMGRADDYPGRALEYYSSRGETPMRWAGALAARLGLVGEVTPEQYDAVMAPGGFRDPLTGERLVSTKNPYVEIVVAAHKATALLGVLPGRAEDMHAILDVERDGTMDWLEASMQKTGGRRGRAARVTPTTGFVYAYTRHGTSRAGDPSPHDHVTIANVTEMLDDKGGYKALFTALFRDRVEAATMYGRLCSAAEAVRRGYAIELDNGPSGRLRHWRIKGIPAEVCEQMSKRSDAIGEYLSENGHVGYRARNIAARATRETKRGTGVEELLPLWEAELAAIGWPIHRLEAALEVARLECRGLAPALTAAEIDAIAHRLLDVEGEFLARGKVFTRSRLIAEVAPLLYGHDPAELDHVLDRIIGCELVVPLIGIAGVREQVYTAAAVLEAELTIAGCVERLIEADGPQLDPTRILRAIAAKQDDIGAELSDGQYRAIEAICGSGRAVDVVVGIAGSGKTTALDAAASGLEEAGYKVIGTATSGQAARTLGAEAGIEARTMRSLLWQLDRGGIVLDPSSVVVLDEAGMTADNDMARLLLAVEAARAKVVIVGDDRQLSAVGPGGALHAVLDEHPDVVTVLTENMRQRNPAERDALLELRSGDLDQAITWYAENDRIAVAADPVQALVGIADAYVADVEAGADTYMLAWQRQNVAALNRLARDAARQRGWLQGPDLELPDGRLFAIGDIVVMLAPNYEGQLVTSERARIVAIDHAADAITIETEHGRRVTLLGTDLDPERIDYGYALTVHREQGATCDRTHYYADGGGRELAYVANSRARHHTTIYTVADDVDQAVERLRDDWSQLQHDSWLTPTTSIGDDSRHAAAEATRLMERARLQAELDATLALPPADVTNELDLAVARLDALHDQRDHLNMGTGSYESTRIGRVVRQLHELGDDLADARKAHADARPWQRRQTRRLVDTQERHHAARVADWDRYGRPEALRIDHARHATEADITELERRDSLHRTWHRLHPEHVERVRFLEQAVADLGRPELPQSSNAQVANKQPYRETPDPEIGYHEPDPPSVSDDYGLGL
jgi:conjugative relaxase-like TrwC/TraI family protein